MRSLIRKLRPIADTLRLALTYCALRRRCGGDLAKCLKPQRFAGRDKNRVSEELMRLSVRGVGKVRALAVSTDGQGRRFTGREAFGAHGDAVIGGDGRHAKGRSPVRQRFCAWSSR